jgi:FG-GAP-like repeat/FG-GAP repeat
VFGLFVSHSALSQTLSKQFVVPQQLSGVTSPLIAVGDLNGDGRPDILYQNSAQIATGNGTFKSIAEPVTFPQGSILADVNGDKKLDVVVAVPADEQCDYNPDGSPYCNINSDAILKVYFGNGDGTFRTGTSFDLGQEGSGLGYLTIVDVNGDGKPDAIATFSGNPEDSASQDGFVLLNDGTGNFKLAPGTYGFQTVLASGDFNGDGKTDLVVGLGPTILYGKGDGTFTTGRSYSLNANAAVVGDFNHDGHLDLAVSNYTTGVYTFWGQAGGTFAAPKLIFPFGASYLQAADLNHDGYLDLIAASSSSVDVYTNQRNGAFSSPRVFAATGNGYYPSPFGLADFNRDGYLDIAFQNQVAYGASGAAFQDPIITQSAYAGGVVTADFNGDGIDDVAVTNLSTGSVTVFTGSGKGYFNVGKTYSTPIVYGNIAAGDVNGDGVKDIVVTRSIQSPVTDAYDVSVLLGNADGTFRSAISSKVLGSPASYTYNRQSFAVDVNHDGKADLIGYWGVALGKGDGTFSAPKPFPSQALPVIALAVGDINHDGNEDIMVGQYSTSSTIYTLVGDGHGNFTVKNAEKLNYTHPQLNALTLADINGNGSLDLIYEYSATPSIGAYDRIVVEQNDGSGTFGNATGVRLPYMGGAYDTLLVDDFNRDGKMDILDLMAGGSVYQPTTGDSILINGTGGGGLAAPQYFPLQMTAGVVLDINGDGAPDLAGPSLDDVGVERVLNAGAKQ